jgi:hypothetical protein
MIDYTSSTQQTATLSTLPGDAADFFRILFRFNAISSSEPEIEATGRESKSGSNGTWIGK